MSRTQFPSLEAAFLAASIVAASFLWQGSIGFNLLDEGFLWYGVQRVLAGEVPLRDFMAYDPGRYYWSAALLALFRAHGIIALRAAVALFQFLGLFAGLLLISRTAGQPARLYLLLASIPLAVWMFPRHKLFDASVSILLAAILAFLIQSPSPRRYFLTGLCVGFTIFFGRNHGLYGTAASLAAILWLNIRRSQPPPLLRAAALWSAGFLAGLAPMLAMALLVPGFARAIVESVRLLFEAGTTNIALPIPWPWRADFAATPLTSALRSVSLGCFFIALLLFAALSLAFVFRERLRARPVPPVLAASAFLALPYAHYAFSRADAGHLALGIFPFLLGSLALLATLPAARKWPLALLIAALSLFTALPFHPGWQSAAFVPLSLSGSDLLVDPGTARDIALLRLLAAQYAPNGRLFLAAPLWPGAYAVLERKSPIWDIYPISPRSPALQQAEIASLASANPGFAILVDLPLDGRADLLFRNTNPLIYDYILDHFTRISTPSYPGYRIYAAKRNVP